MDVLKNYMALKMDSMERCLQKKLKKSAVNIMEQQEENLSKQSSNNGVEKSKKHLKIF